MIIKKFLALIAFLLPWQTCYIWYVPIYGEQSSAFGVSCVYAVQALLIFGLGSLYFWKGLPKFTTSSKRILGLASGIFVVATLSLLRTPDPLSGLGALWNILCAGLLFASLLDRRVDVEFTLRAFAYGLLVPIALGILQVLCGFSPASSIFGLATRNAATHGDAVFTFFGQRILRAYGSFPHPNVFAGYLAVALAGLVGSRSFRETYSMRLYNAKILHNFRIGSQSTYYLLLTTYCLALLATGSRSALLGLALGLFLAWIVPRFKNMQHARLAVVPIALGTIGLALFVTYTTPNLVALTRGGSSLELRSLRERQTQVMQWWDSMHGVDWLVGEGLSGYVPSITSCTGDACDASLQRSYTQPVHSLPLLILAELGFIGLLVILSWSSTIDHLNFSRFPNHDALRAFAMGNVILVILFFDHYLWTLWPGLALITLVMACTVRMGEREVA